ncbi:DUF3054 domain-containing protein [Corynebacterium dentalis]|uniref:DUF3054 domain-containing protein n=1 Tax=Corynebacterium dentalis TaxID=2014528 RepID=UPI00289D03F0|nr:DUF3054 domain-containing protein [Corynebacterium dentalis]
MTTSASTEPARSKTVLTAFVADLIAIAAFGLFARVAHQSADMPLNVLSWLNTTWPFWLGVLVAWALLWWGMMGSRSGHELSTVLPVWVGAVVVGLGVWTLRNGSLPHWSFVIVACVMSALLLWGWRLVARLFGARAGRS